MLPASFPLAAHRGTPPDTHIHSPPPSHPHLAGLTPELVTTEKPRVPARRPTWQSLGVCWRPRSPHPPHPADSAAACLWDAVRLLTLSEPTFATDLRSISLPVCLEYPSSHVLWPLPSGPFLPNLVQGHLKQALGGYLTELCLLKGPPPFHFSMPMLAVWGLAHFIAHPGPGWYFCHHDMELLGWKGTPQV